MASSSGLMFPSPQPSPALNLVELAQQRHLQALPPIQESEEPFGTMLGVGSGGVVNDQETATKAMMMIKREDIKEEDEDEGTK